MSTEEIINAWKQEPQLGKKPAKALPPTKEPETKPAEAPGNPAGEQELNDEQLELVEGGTQGSTLYCTKYGHTCTNLD